MTYTIILDMNHPTVQHLCKIDKRLTKVISMVRTLSYEPLDDGYSFIVHEIIEQMLSIKAGAKVYSRLIELCDGKISPERINALSDEQIRGTGTSSNKVSYIIVATDSIISSHLSLTTLHDLSDKEVVKELTRIKGIGNWTKNVLNFCVE